MSHSHSFSLQDFLPSVLDFDEIAFVQPIDLTEQISILESIIIPLSLLLNIEFLS
jgi:hypothetical protein